MRAASRSSFTPTRSRASNTGSRFAGSTNTCTSTSKVGFATVRDRAADRVADAGALELLRDGRRELGRGQVAFGGGLGHRALQSVCSRARCARDNGGSGSDQVRSRFRSARPRASASRPGTRGSGSLTGARATCPGRVPTRRVPPAARRRPSSAASSSCLNPRHSRVRSPLQVFFSQPGRMRRIARSPSPSNTTTTRCGRTSFTTPRP